MNCFPKRRIEKIVISGDVIEWVRYCNPINVEPREHSIFKDIEDFESKRDDNLFRARQNIRRIIWCNITPYTKFLTLTYADTVLDNDVVIYDFKQFIKNLRRKGFNVPYLYITEHQKGRGVHENNEGCLHIHAVLFTDDYIPYEIINKAWGKGYTDIHRLKDINNLGAYVCKYLTKEEFNLYHKHSYHISRGLKRSEVLTTDGYLGDWGHLYKNIIDNTDFIYSGVEEYSYIAPDGSEHKNTFLYKQGIFNHSKADNYYED